MKIWEKPELKELKASWTKELANAPGVDSVLEEVIIDGQLVQMGSCP